MDLSYEVILSKILSKCEGDSLKVNVYLFGSFLHKPNYQDIDIIVGYKNKESVNDFKKIINVYTIGAPIDYVFFNEITENELMFYFIDKVNAQLIYKKLIN